MTQCRIRPSSASGEVEAPPSKSYTHRALAVAHLSQRRFRIDRPLVSDDTVRTVGAIRMLGSRVELRPHRWTVEPAEPARRTVRIRCGESGTTLRFSSALAALQPVRARFDGTGRLSHRPMAGLTRVLRHLGARARTLEPGRSLPLEITGPIHGGRVPVDASESSQFASALLLSLPTVEPGSTLTLRGPIVSQPYIAATLAVVRSLGVRVTQRGRRFSIPAAQHYTGATFGVPGDASSAAYLWAAAAITGGRVTVTGVPERWPQADLAVLPLLERFGAEVHRTRRGVTVVGNRRCPFQFQLTNSPDLYPLAGVLAATAVGESRLLGASHVAAKESDRRAETIRLVRALGGAARRTPMGLAVSGTRTPRAFHLAGATDHRIVMSAAVGALAGDGASTVADGRTVSKSFPEFFHVLRGLAGSEVVP